MDGSSFCESSIFFPESSIFLAVVENGINKIIPCILRSFIEKDSICDKRNLMLVYILNQFRFPYLGFS